MTPESLESGRGGGDEAVGGGDAPEQDAGAAPSTSGATQGVRLPRLRLPGWEVPLFVLGLLLTGSFVADRIAHTPWNADANEARLEQSAAALADGRPDDAGDLARASLLWAEKAPERGVDAAPDRLQDQRRRAHGLIARSDVALMEAGIPTEGGGYRIWDHVEAAGERVHGGPEGLDLHVRLADAWHPSPVPDPEHFDRAGPVGPRMVLERARERFADVPGADFELALAEARVLDRLSPLKGAELQTALQSALNEEAAAAGTAEEVAARRRTQGLRAQAEAQRRAVASARSAAALADDAGDRARALDLVVDLLDRDDRVDAAITEARDAFDSAPPEARRHAAGRLSDLLLRRRTAAAAAGVWEDLAGPAPADDAPPAEHLAHARDLARSARLLLDGEGLSAAPRARDLLDQADADLVLAEGAGEGDPDLAAEVRLLAGRAASYAGDRAEAESAFEELARSRDPDIALRARLAWARELLYGRGSGGRTRDEWREFFGDLDPQVRERVIDDLLNRPRNPSKALDVLDTAIARGVDRDAALRVLGLLEEAARLPTDPGRLSRTERAETLTRLDRTRALADRLHAQGVIGDAAHSLFLAESKRDSAALHTDLRGRPTQVAVRFSREAGAHYLDAAAELSGPAAVDATWGAALSFASAGYASGEIDALRSFLVQTSGTGDPRVNEALMRLGRAWARLGQTRNAEDILVENLERFPGEFHTPQTRLLLAEVREQAGDLDGEVAVLRDLVRNPRSGLTPASPVWETGLFRLGDALLRRARDHEKAGRDRERRADLDAARRTFEEALHRYAGGADPPDDRIRRLFRARWGLAQTLVELADGRNVPPEDRTDRLERAVDALDTALRTPPDVLELPVDRARLKETRLLRADTLWMLGRDDPDRLRRAAEALEETARIHRTGPDTVYALLRAGEAWSRLGDERRAEEAFSRASVAADALTGEAAAAIGPDTWRRWVAGAESWRDWRRRTGGDPEGDDR